MPTKKSSRSSRSSAGKTGLGTLIVLAVVIILGGYYAVSGADPLGLFGKAALTSQPTAVVDDGSIESPVTETKEPSITEEIPTDEPTPASPTGTMTDIATETAPLNSIKAWNVYFVNPLRLKESEETTFRAKIPAANYKGSIAEKLIAQINNAQKTIHIASFEADLTDIANALIEAKKRGVDVRWITDDESGIEADSKPGHGQFKTMKAAGIPIKDDARGALMHDKFWLFDSRIVWTGSTNVTVSGMFEQNNNVIVITSTKLAAIYESQFEDMWAGKFNAKSPSTVDKQSISINHTTIQVLFSPEDKAISHLVPYVQQAKSSIRFMAFTYTQDDLGGAMIARKKAGVDVQGVFEATGSDTEFSEMPPLYCAKVPVRKDGNPAFLHHKVIVIDEHIVITGSLNFTDNADQNNNENVIIIDDAEIAKLYLQEFQKVWDAGSAPDKAKMKCN